MSQEIKSKRKRCTKLVYSTRKIINNTNTPKYATGNCLATTRS